MDALALGAAVAVWVQLPGVAQRLSAQRHRWAGGSLAMFLAGAVLTHGYPRSTPIGQTLGYSWLALSFAMGVLAIAVSPPLDAARWHTAWRAPWLRRVGLYSYAMYVFHKPLHDHVGLPLLRRFGLHDAPSCTVGLAYVLACMAASFIAAMLSYHLIEKRLLGWKRLFVARLPSVA